MKTLPLLVLAGGFGTRLQSVITNVPKPLAPIGSRPFLDFLLQNWREAGIEEFIFLLHHKAELIESYLQQVFKHPAFNQCRYSTVIEPTPLGTGGSIANAIKERGYEGDFIAANADTWLPTGMKFMLSAPTPSMAITKVANCNRYGKVITQENRILTFEEKQAKSESGWINAGLYRLNSQYFQDWPTQAMSLETSLLPKLVKSGKMHAIQCDCDFIDIGVPSEYEYFQKMVAAQGSDT